MITTYYYDVPGKYCLDRREDALKECGPLDALLIIICQKLGRLQDLLDEPRNAVMCLKDEDGMANSEYTDQIAPSAAV